MASSTCYVKLASLPASERKAAANKNIHTRNAIEDKIDAILADRRALQNDQRKANDTNAQEEMAENLGKLKLGNDARDRNQHRAAHRLHDRQAAAKKARERQDALRAEVFAKVERLLLKRRQQLKIFDKTEAADGVTMEQEDKMEAPRCAGMPGSWPE